MILVKTLNNDIIYVIYFTFFLSLLCFGCSFIARSLFCCRCCCLFTIRHLHSASYMSSLILIFYIIAVVVFSILWFHAVIRQLFLLFYSKWHSLTIILLFVSILLFFFFINVFSLKINRIILTNNKNVFCIMWLWICKCFTFVY